ncbi:hypothetical protein CAC42_5274 [Sphaceloma murrayae]|uniref:TIP41-like protein n=1 Tax=Sphaceloma murrayae TaxID=2082308 RepID=A0A2K1QUJ6_9PEZI|nr:hypothetical protein CAC42_5274 [Sphaceloma murrayae]
MSATDKVRSDHGPGIKSHSTRDQRWRISSCKLPILKADPIEQMNKDLGIPVPEMIFGDNFVIIEHQASKLRLDFNAFDALDKVSKTKDGMLQVAVAEEWKKERQHQDGIKEVVKPFDWSYSTDFCGLTVGASTGWQPTTEQENPIRTDLLSRHDPILFFDDVVLYEDELADNGIAMFSVKVRVMPERMLLLSRFFLRLDGVIVRVRDTRVYIELGSNRIIRQYTAKEDTYDKMRSKLQGRRENVPEALRDSNLMSSMLPVVEDRLEYLDVSG